VFTAFKETSNSGNPVAAVCGALKAATVNTVGAQPPAKYFADTVATVLGAITTGASNAYASVYGCFSGCFRHHQSREREQGIPLLVDADS
jgi:hypothetical protein